jgi:hypothetical protein
MEPLKSRGKGLATQKLAHKARSKTLGLLRRLAEK